MAIECKPDCFEHHDHYGLDDLPLDRQHELNSMESYDRPLWVGQGWTKSVGSDCYGGYVVEIKTVGRKEVIGLVAAKVCIGPDGWIAGTQHCCMPDNRAPQEWVTQRGWWKKLDGSKGKPKYFFCDQNGIIYKGQKCTYGWNGASSYRDPSF